MTAQEKNALSRFLNLAEDYLGSGYARETVEPSTVEFSGEPSLPLAYMVEEEESNLPDSPENLLALVIDAGSVRAEEKYLDRILASAGLFRSRNALVINEDSGDSFPEHISNINPKTILFLGIPNRQINFSAEIPVFTITHPNDFLSDEPAKRRAFEDLKIMMIKLAESDSEYAAEVKELLRKYAAADANYAARVQRFIA